MFEGVGGLFDALIRIGATESIYGRPDSTNQPQLFE